MIERHGSRRLALKGGLAGLGAGVAMALLMAALRLGFGILSLPEVLADWFTRILPPAVFDFLLATFQTWAKPLMFLGLMLALTLVGGAFGMVYAVYGRRLSVWVWRPFGRGVLLAMVLWAATMLFLFASGSFQDIASGGMPAFVLAMLASYLGYTTLLTFLVHRMWQSSKGTGEVATVDLERRAFMKMVGVGVAVLVAGGLIGKAIVEGIRSVQPSQVFSTKGSMPPEITPNELF